MANKNSYNPNRPVSTTKQRAAELGSKNVPSDKKPKKIKKPEYVSPNGMEFLVPIEDIRRNKSKASYLMDIIVTIADWDELKRAKEAGEEVDDNIKLTQRQLGDILSVIEDYFLLDVVGYDNYINNPTKTFAEQYVDAMKLAVAVTRGLAY